MTLDNAVIESWRSTLEFEFRSLERFATRAAARGPGVSTWIEDYNRHRRHSAVGMMSLDPVGADADGPAKRLRQPLTAQRWPHGSAAARGFQACRTRGAWIMNLEETDADVFF